MSTFLFILGKDRQLSMAELLSVYPLAEFEFIGTDFVALKLNTNFVQDDLNRLGGVVKVARLLTSVNFKGVVRGLVAEIEERYADKKLHYGLSIYDASQKNLRSWLSELKKSLKRADFKTRFANQNAKNISVAQHKGLASANGFEFLICKTQKAFLLGEVIAVQDIDAYSRRDFKKPFRSMKVGMLPPKLAQILINLTGLKKGTVWDPFCGGGVLLMEGLLAGFDVLGSDINKKTLEGAKKNVEWVKSNKSCDLFYHDATEPLADKHFDAIACEGYLGPPQSRLLAPQKLDSLLPELQTLYVQFFHALRQIEFKGPVVMAMPFFRMEGGGEVFLDKAITQIQQMGFQKIPLLPKDLMGRDCLQLKYARDDQVVGRAIYRFMLG